MTENKREEMLKDIRDGYIDAWDNMTIDELFKEIEKEHKEIQAYRAIGTVEVCKANKTIADKMSKQVLWNADLLEEYAAIGTVSEFKALKERKELDNSDMEK